MLEARGAAGCRSHLRPCCRRPGAGAHQAPSRSPRRVPQRGRGPASPPSRGALVNPLKPSGGCWVAGHSPLSLSLGDMAARCPYAAGLPPAGRPVRVEAGPAGWLVCSAPPLEATSACGWEALCGLGRRAEALPRRYCLMPAALHCPELPAPRSVSLPPPAHPVPALLYGALHAAHIPLCLCLVGPVRGASCTLFAPPASLPATTD